MVLKLMRFAFFLLAFAAQLGLSQQSLLAKRKIDRDRFFATRGAILLKDDKPTSCEIGLLGLSAGVVSANCLNFTSIGEVDTKVKYSVLMYDGKLNSTSTAWVIDPKDIHVHPSFQLEALIYNIAVVKFNKDSDSSYKTYIVGDFYDVTQSAYTFRPYNSSSFKWEEPKIITQENDPGELCNKELAVYKATPFRWSCNNAVFSISDNNACAVPYNALYTERGGEVALVAIYSHSVILGTDMCSSEWLNAYTYVQYYMTFFEEVLGRSIDIIYNGKPANSSVATFDDISLRMPDYYNATGKIIVGGNLYEAQYPRAEEPVGLSKTNKIIIAVVTPAGAIVVALCAYFLYRLWSKSQRDRNRSLEEQLHLRELANELVVDTGHGKPPSLRRQPVSETAGSTPPSYFISMRTVDNLNRGSVNTMSVIARSSVDKKD